MNVKYKDECWHAVRRAAQAKNQPDKEPGDGPLRRLKAELYDVAKTKAECNDVQRRALVEIDRLYAIPVPLTQAEEITELRARLDAVEGKTT